MIRMKVKISEEDYEKYKNQDYKEYVGFIENLANATVFPSNAYGCYPLGLLTDKINL